MRLNSDLFDMILHFETAVMVELKLTNNTKLVVVSIYRLLFISQGTFLEEFEDLLEMLSVMKEDWIIVGDVNFHLETDYDAALFKETLMTFNLLQYVNFPTHVHKDTLWIWCLLVMIHQTSPVLK